jgi:hypothetical protein
MNLERNGWRDLTYHLEHRRSMPDECGMIDLDSVGFRQKPRTILYVAEVAYTPAPPATRKAAPITGAVAAALDIEGYVVQYETERPLEFCPGCNSPIQGSAGAITTVHVRDARFAKSWSRSMPAADWWNELRGLYS